MVLSELWHGYINNSVYQRNDVLQYLYQMFYVPLQKCLLCTIYPSLQSHMYEPWVFIHFSSQPPLFIRHSLMSADIEQNNFPFKKLCDEFSRKLCCRKNKFLHKLNFTGISSPLCSPLGDDYYVPSELLYTRIPHLQQNMDCSVQRNTVYWERIAQLDGSVCCGNHKTRV